jgi:hypothetical protein
MIFDDVSSHLTVSNSGLTVTCNTNGYFATAQPSVGFNTGKKYWEFLITGVAGANRFLVGGGSDLNTSIENNLTWTPLSGAAVGYNGGIYQGGTLRAQGSSFTVGDVIGVACDADSGKMWFSKNGVWQVGGDPSAGSLPNISGLSGYIKPAVGLYDAGASVIARFAEKNRASLSLLVSPWWTVDQTLPL